MGVINRLLEVMVNGVKLRADLAVPALAAGGNFEVNTRTDAGTNYAQFPDIQCLQVTVAAPNDYDIEVLQDAAGAAFPVRAGGSQTFFGIANANQLSVRRIDTVAQAVKVSGRWEG